MYEDLSFHYGNGAYAMYLRKSRRDLEAEARGEGETLKRHLELLKDLAKRLGLNVVKIYAEVVSGESIDARPRMQQLLRDVETGIYDGVLVAEVERLARGDTSDQGRVAKTFQFSGTLIITPSRTYDPNDEFDEEYFEFGLFMSRREYKTIRRRLSAGADASRREGKYTGNVAPYGYERYKLKKEKGWSLKIVPEQARVVRMIFDWYHTGLNGEKAGYGRIAGELNRLGICAPLGGQWTPCGVQSLLRNPVYAGYIKNGYRKEVRHLSEGQMIKSRPLNRDCELYPGRHEAIISQETWEAVSSRMKKRSASPSTRKRPQKNPLAGLVRCSCCRRIMQRRPFPGNTPAALICTTPGCPTVSAPLFLVEQRILEAISLRLSSCPLPPPDPSPSHREKLAALNAGVEACRTAILEARAQLERQYDLLERGIYTEETFFERKASICRREEELTARLEALQQEFRKESDREAAALCLPPAFKSLPDICRRMESPAARNALFKELIDHVEYTRTEGGRWGVPDAFTLEIFPKVT